MRDKGEFGTAANHYLSALYHSAVKLGVDVIPLLNRVGLSTADIDKPKNRIPTEKLSAIQISIWDITQDESMGLNGFPLKRGSYYMMGKLTIHQTHLGKVLSLGQQFYNLLVNDNFITIRQEGDNTVLRVQLVSPEADPDHLFAEITLLAWHRYSSWIIAQGIPLAETRFNYSPPLHVNEYTYLYPGKHVFDSDELALVFPSRYLEYEVKQTESTLVGFLKRCPLELFRQYKDDYSLSSELRRLLVKHIWGAKGSIADCASQLHMTPRTMMRKLKEEGTSFQQLKDYVRRDKAIMLLTQQKMAISEVAEQIGYSDSAVFTRAFRQWTGLSPRKYRDKHTLSKQG